MTCAKLVFVHIWYGMLYVAIHVLWIRPIGCMPDSTLRSNPVVECCRNRAALITVNGWWPGTSHGQKNSLRGFLGLTIGQSAVPSPSAALARVHPARTQTTNRHHPRRSTTIITTRHNQHDARNLLKIVVQNGAAKETRKSRE